MLKFALRRLLDIVLVLILVSFFTTSLVNLMPGSPAFAIYGSSLSPQFLANFNHEFGLDHPLFVRYGLWVWHALQGDLGSSFQTHFSVASQIGSRLPVTAEIAVLALLFSLLIAVPVAMLAATRPGKLADRVV